MTIQKKLYLGFLGSTISVMVVGAFSIHSLSVTAGSLQEMIGTTLREVKETSRAAQSAVALDTKIDDFIDAVDHKRSAEALAAKQSIAMYFVVVSAAISGLRDEANEMLKIEDTQEEILEEKQHIARIDDLDSARGQLQHNWDEISAKVETNDKVDDELLRKNDIENHNLVSQALELQDGARGEISETLTDTAQSVSLQWFIVLVAGAGAVMLTATIALMTAGPLGRRLHEVRTKAGQVGGGDLAVRIDIKGKDEISDLARTFNHMAENLAASREQLVDSAARAEAANNAKSAFLANMSHEIRTPMTAIMGYAERLLEHKESFGEHAEALQIIQSSGGHLLDLINDILDISKIEANKLAVERAEMDLPQIAVDVISLLRAHAVARGVALHLSFSDFIPQTIRSDPLRVKQILMNIVGNALKFTEHGTVRLHIDCQASELSSLITMEVTDTGIGISKEQLERLFQPFAQADESTTRRFGGTGLGLTISKHLAQLLGGGLSVESIAGVGSSFKISIDGGSLAGVKMLSGLKESMLAKPRAETQSSPEIKLNCRILLVEDGPENQKLLSLHLTEAGAGVTIAKNGLVALDLYEQQKFDLILMDMQLPEMDGYAATKELRARGCDLPIVALTAHAMSEDREKCMQAGCSGYLTKPINRKLLLKTIAEFVNPLGTSKPDTVAANRQPLRSSLAGEPLYQDLIQEYVDGLPAQVERIESAVRDQNIGQLQKELHSLRGTAGGLGFAPLTDLAAEAGASVKAASAMSDIENQVCRLIDEIRRVQGFNEKQDRVIEALNDQA